jgi:hypothetical protein
MRGNGRGGGFVVDLLKEAYVVAVINGGLADGTTDVSCAAKNHELLLGVGGSLSSCGSLHVKALL